MRTTLRINEDIYRRAKAKSGERGLSLTRFFEEAVEERLASLEQRATTRMVLPVSSVSGPPLTDEELRRRIEAADLENDFTKVG